MAQDGWWPNPGELVTRAPRRRRQFGASSLRHLLGPEWYSQCMVAFILHRASDTNHGSKGSSRQWKVALLLRRAL